MPHDSIQVPVVPPRIEKLMVRNYRALRDITLSLTPFTVLLGPNGSGKSTVFDVFAFLSECFTIGLRKAWDKRNRFKELRSRESDGPVEIEIKYREPNQPLITYHISVDETESGPVVSEEWLQWRRGRQTGRPFKFLSFHNGAGMVISGDQPDETDNRVEETLDSPDILAVNAFGQLAKHPRVSALRRFITGWHLSYFTADTTRAVPDAGPAEHLSQTGDNLPNVIQYLKERHPDQLKKILEILQKRVPRLESVEANLMPDGRLLLQLKDAPFREPVLAKFASDGTLKLLAYLTVLHDPNPLPLVGIEEPENHLHPLLLPELAEEVREATARTQVLVTTHSPFFINVLRPEEVWVLYRDERGYTKAMRPADMPHIRDFIEHGANLGQLWMENYFTVGDPFKPSNT